MKIAVIGTGYVGLVSGACFADFGHDVVCADLDEARIDALQQLEIPFYEPGLGEVVERNVTAGRLHFTTSIAEAVSSATVVFLAVGTPEGKGGHPDLSQIVSAATTVADHVQRYTVLVTKSTVPVGTSAWLAELLLERLDGSAEIDVVSNPEFLREGSAVSDFMRPDRVVIGAASARAAAIMREIYRPLYLIETPIVMTDRESAELIKYASNAFLAVKIGFINEIANLCDRVGADVHVVAKGMGLDKRIGSKFLHAGPGYGGSCFPKDTRALAALGAARHVRQRIVETAIEVNDRQRELIVEKIRTALGTLRGRRVAVLGLSFKPNTSDVRESAALYVCRHLAAEGATLRAFDPVAAREAAHALEDVNGHITYASDAYAAAEGADALVIMTEWNEFRSLDLDLLRRVMANRVVVDTRNVLDPALARAAGFVYACTGREKVVGVEAAV
jgi:UDPglucose 6-dehydrogenase